MCPISATSVKRMNRLGRETSPYLLQLAENPVYWVENDPDLDSLRDDLRFKALKWRA